jgi:hypothetical protein
LEARHAADGISGIERDELLEAERWPIELEHLLCVGAVAPEYVH